MIRSLVVVLLLASAASAQTYSLQFNSRGQLLLVETASHSCALCNAGIGATSTRVVLGRGRFAHEQCFDQAFKAAVVNSQALEQPPVMLKAKVKTKATVPLRTRVRTQTRYVPRYVPMAVPFRQLDCVT